ncbi:hypothetical protein D0867_01997 [Hortaea werneckii]|uniref:Uncharacterized protein n=3 Tax=Hortaea werneckii TaxID=91943 RepID=A0A3M7A7D2_HORWE|nr:hypothetical protein D0867_01997 [Hortaea werneckii]
MGAQSVNQQVKMPVMPQQEHQDLSEAVQKPKETGEQAKNLATADDHKANPGPVMAENLGQPASKEELKKRAEELNKK